MIVLFRERQRVAFVFSVTSTWYFLCLSDWRGISHRDPSVCKVQGCFLRSQGAQRRKIGQSPGGVQARPRKYHHQREGHSDRQSARRRGQRASKTSRQAGICRRCGERNQGDSPAIRKKNSMGFFWHLSWTFQDQSRYTVTFNDGDIATLRRNALCMKSGKHYSASESLDNLPLTHPEHFSTPVSGSRRRGGKRASGSCSCWFRRYWLVHFGVIQRAVFCVIGNDTDDYDSSSDGEEVPSFYLTNIGRVVWAENTDKKCKTKESW